MSSPMVSAFQPSRVGTSIARFVFPDADGKAPAKYLTAPCGEVSLRMSMCSASQPSSRAITLAMRSAKHFLPSSALPPYPEPYDQISRVSGKWTMYLLSGLHGHGTSTTPAPGEYASLRRGQRPKPRAQRPRWAHPRAPFRLPTHHEEPDVGQCVHPHP